MCLWAQGLVFSLETIPAGPATHRMDRRSSLHCPAIFWEIPLAFKDPLFLAVTHQELKGELALWEGEFRPRDEGVIIKYLLAFIHSFFHFTASVLHCSVWIYSFEYGEFKCKFTVYNLFHILVVPWIFGSLVYIFNLFLIG